MATKKEAPLDQKGVIEFDPEIHVMVIKKEHDAENQTYKERTVRVSRELAEEQLSLPKAERHISWRNVEYAPVKQVSKPVLKQEDPLEEYEEHEFVPGEEKTKRTYKPRTK